MDQAARAHAQSSLPDFAPPRFPGIPRYSQRSRSALPSRSASLQRHRQRYPQLHPLSGISQSLHRHQSLVRQRYRGSGRHPALSREHQQSPARLSSSPYALPHAPHCPALLLPGQPVPFARLSQGLQAGLPLVQSAGSPPRPPGPRDPADGSHPNRPDRKSVVYGKSVDLGGRRIIKKKKKKEKQERQEAGERRRETGTRGLEESSE